MAQKTVYLNIGQRRKKIKYARNEGVGDMVSIHNALQTAIELDPPLKSTTKDAFIILQQKDCDGVLCDIDADDIIENNAQLEVVIVPMPSDVMEFDVQSDSKPANEIISLNQPSHNALSQSSSDSMKYENDSSNENKRKNENQLEARKSKMSKTSHLPVPYPVDLPPLTAHLQNIANTVGYYSKQAPFISHWADHLRQITDDEPTKSDYRNYAMSIVDAYPKLKGGKDHYGIVKEQLSAKIRRDRHQENHAVKKSTNVPQVKLITDPKSTQENQQETNFDLEDSLKELQKCTPLDDSNHVRRLLMLTFSFRRSFVTDAENVTTVIAKFPQLINPKAIMWEFCAIIKMEEVTLVNRSEQVLAELAKFFEMDAENEEQKAFILGRLYEHLLPKKFKKIKEHLITVVEAGKSTKDLLTSDGTSPRAVLYYMEKGIATAFIVASGTRIKIEDPTTVKVILCLVGAYFAWNVSYPPAYAPMLLYIEKEILNISSSKKGGSVDKFIRDVNNKIAENNNK